MIGLRVTMYLWSLCHIKFEGVVPEKCVTYDNYRCLELDLFKTYLDNTLEDLKNGFDLAMVYYGNIDQVGHDFGPDTEELKEEIRQTDQVLLSFINQLDDDTNVIIVTDHGKTFVTLGF